ncbi:uncharacterized protein AMSG_01664 [Thecamonas trahens ATCC 50062]|uniref:Cupin type-1 domain-containing protein n=1 Tax=Thecamonas trahens ATCC 50062 TaxID=461836 RepID=A0A0L0DRD0_THETB|nr:hypothetical protein AMSG_01664 [Thecamonas trahens ATCC 50062]KNC54812.1 hypothetical protein AMSG_01664 [Thecamonas trahens ATCC 50062]|eukprot:XP_013761711.1 hypothetical protein AMSG_01664 [Thecamonas trahens ATCC 50062]
MALLAAAASAPAIYQSNLVVPIVDVYPDAAIAVARDAPLASSDARGAVIKAALPDSALPSEAHVLYSKRGARRSGDLHPMAQYDYVVSGRALVTRMAFQEIGFRDGQAVGSRIETKASYGPGETIVIDPHTPHVFEFDADTVMLEWWAREPGLHPLRDGYYYIPYRAEIDPTFKSYLADHGLASR